MKQFWAWYERHYALNVSIAAALFAVQILHLLWLTFDPFWFKVFGDSLVVVDKPYSWPLLVVDYTEIPALISVSLVYLNELRTGGPAWRPVLFLVLLNSQWLHIFWITDEFVVETNSSQVTVLPVWLAYLALLIDYAEVPIIVDTVRKMVGALREEQIGRFLREDLRDA